MTSLCKIQKSSPVASYYKEIDGVFPFLFIRTMYKDIFMHILHHKKRTFISSDSPRDIK
jgi:hypothetical protein